MYLALVEIHRLHVSWTSAALHSPSLWVPVPSSHRPPKAVVSRASFTTCICWPSNTFANHHNRNHWFVLDTSMNLAMCMVDFLLHTLQQSCGYYTFNPDEKVEACYSLTCPGTLLVSRRVPKSTVSTTRLYYTASVIWLGGCVSRWETLISLVP